MMKGEDGNDIYVLMIWQKTDKIRNLQPEDFNIPEEF